MSDLDSTVTRDSTSSGTERQHHKTFHEQARGQKSPDDNTERQQLVCGALDVVVGTQIKRASALEGKFHSMTTQTASQSADPIVLLVFFNGLRL